MRASPDPWPFCLVHDMGGFLPASSVEKGFFYVTIIYKGNSTPRDILFFTTGLHIHCIFHYLISIFIGRVKFWALWNFPAPAPAKNAEQIEKFKRANQPCVWINYVQKSKNCLGKKVKNHLHLECNNFIVNLSSLAIFFNVKLYPCDRYLIAIICQGPSNFLSTSCLVQHCPDWKLTLPIHGLEPRIRVSRKEKTAKIQGILQSKGWKAIE